MVDDKARGDAQSMAQSIARSAAQDTLSTCETLPVPALALKAKAVTEPIPRDFFFIPVPRYLRHNPERPAHFSLFLNCLFAVATTFSK